jgi:hypothetical protein
MGDIEGLKEVNYSCGKMMCEWTMDRGFTVIVAKVKHHCFWKFFVSLKSGELLKPTCTVKISTHSYGSSLYLCIFELLGCYYDCNYTYWSVLILRSFILYCSLPSPCILLPWRWPHIWLKHVGVHCVYKLILTYLCAFVGTIIVYTWIMHRSYHNNNSLFGLDC